MLKYTVDFNDRLNDTWRLEVDSPDYTGEPIALTPADKPVTREYNGNSDDDIFKMHVISSSLTINVVNTGLDLEELMYINDASYKCRLYRSGVLDWSGYIVADNIQEKDSGIPYDVVIRAIDGLEVLNNIDFTWSNNLPAITVDGQVSSLRSPMHALRLALFGSGNLDNPLPIRWNTSLKNMQYPSDDMLAGRTTINGAGELIEVKENTGYWWLDNISKSALSWCYQKSGRWYFNNYFDTLSGNFGGHEISTDTSIAQTAIPYNGNEVTEVLATDTVNENWFWFGKKPFGKVTVLYNDTRFPNNNLVPNSDFTQTSTGVLTCWVASKLGIFLNQESSIDGRAESRSMEVLNTLEDGNVSFREIPVDTDVLFKECTIGFHWLPISGYYVFTQTGFIDFSKNPISVSISLEFATERYYLNEFGYWWNETTAQPSQQVFGTDYVGGAYKIGFTFGRNFIVGDRFQVIFMRSGTLEFYNVTFNEVMTMDDGVEYIRTFIPNTSVETSTAGKILVINDVTDSIQNSATVVVDEFFIKNINLTGGDAMKLNDILAWTFISKGSAGNIKMPSGLGKLRFEIFSKGGSTMRIGNVYFNVSDNKDVYEISESGSKNSKENYEVGISSSFSGNMVSSYGDSYRNRNESMLWTGGKTLTQIYGEAILNTRNEPRRVFSGDIDKIVEWGLFTLMGKTYAPLSMSLDCQSLITSVTGVEFKPVVKLYNVVHKSNEGA